MPGFGLEVVREQEWEWEWGWEEEVKLSLEVPPKQLQQSAAGTHPAERERTVTTIRLPTHLPTIHHPYISVWQCRIVKSGENENWLSGIWLLWKSNAKIQWMCMELLAHLKKKQWQWDMSFWKVTWNIFLNRTGDWGSVIAIVWAPAWQ